jgi:hypothetical protein
MYKYFQRAIIIGGGASIRDGQWNKSISDLPLWKNIQNECTFGINYVYHYYKPTVLTFVDYQLYRTHKEELERVPFLICYKHPSFKKCPQGSNLIALPGSSTYYGKNSLDIIKKNNKEQIAGFYSTNLSGLFTLTLCIALRFKEIYLLGFDFTETEGRTHFYQDEAKITPEKFQSKSEDNQVIYGIGKDVSGHYRTNIFEQKPEEYFDIYKKDMDEVKIFNVSPQSKIETFPKINYAEFYRRLENCPEPILQDRTRDYIKDFINLKLKD